MDLTFKTMIARQIRIFLFAGNDSTSSILCYCFYLLSSHPECMAHVRAEHDAVFGPDLSTVPAAIVQTPHLLNQIPYTHAVIKEVLRLFPPASSLREGRPTSTSLTLTAGDIRPAAPSSGPFIKPCTANLPTGNGPTTFCLTAGSPLTPTTTFIRSRAPTDPLSWAPRIASVRTWPRSSCAAPSS